MHNSHLYQCMLYHPCLEMCKAVVVTVLPQVGWCWWSAIREEEMDSLFWKSHIYLVSYVSHWWVMGSKMF